MIGVSVGNRCGHAVIVDVPNRRTSSIQTPRRNGVDLLPKDQEGTRRSLAQNPNAKQQSDPLVQRYPNTARRGDRLTQLSAQCNARVVPVSTVV